MTDSTSSARGDRAVDVSIVIPTYNRMDILPEVLEGVLQQRAIREHQVQAELVVVNDGSEPDTRRFLDEWAAVEPDGGGALLPRRIIHQDNKGPAAARNRGVNEASGRLVAFLGDDTVPKPGWLSGHLAAHQRGEHAGVDPERLGVIGYTGWHSRMRLNPFLRYINDYGLQFGYALIDKPGCVPFNFFYTSNLSVPRSALLAEPFDVDFPYAAWEDIEVSYRLHQTGFRLLYAADACVEHDHPTDLERFGDRQEKAGFCAVVFFLKHPELADFLGVSGEGPPELPSARRFRRNWWLVRTLQRLVSTTGWPWAAPAGLAKLWEDTLRYHYTVGLRRGWHELAEQESRNGSPN